MVAGVGDSLAGVEGWVLVVRGVPDAEALPERFGMVFEARERSRKAKSFLYAVGGQGGRPSNGGSLSARLSLL